MLKIERGNERVILRFPYDPVYITKIKTIKGYRRHPEEKYWSVPYSNNILDCNSAKLNHR
ncbi:MAG: hypothetical protein KAU03_02595 [Candidatus Altiarchaeales archaeon]|nr:hypothetical protein [Candidatus Altiarchaeales archaeon]